jgi:hypothetical protein
MRKKSLWFLQESATLNTNRVWSLKYEVMNYYNYFTEIEEHFVKRRGKHLLISPMDWRLIAEWKEAGVPLQVALRGIDIAMDSFLSRHRRGNTKLNSLCYCHDAVMTEYAEYQDSRVGEPREDSQKQNDSTEQEAFASAHDENEVSEALEYLTAIIQEIKTLAAEQRLCESAIEGTNRVLERLEEVVQPLQTNTRIDLEVIDRDLEIVDAILVDALLTVVSAEQIAEWEHDAKAELKVYRKKLPKEMYRKIHNNYMRGKVHQKFNIREFSLFRL